jgi:dephospho-CoA kinase
MARGWSQEEWQQRELAQLSLQAKQSYSTDTIFNTGSTEDLANEVSRMLEAWSATKQATL